MTSKTKHILLWIAAVLLMFSAAIYQRLTGPTHPARGTVMIEGQKYSFRLIRSEETGKNAKIAIKVHDTAVKGFYKYKRLRLEEDWDGGLLERNGDELVGYLPFQPPAGKLEYMVSLTKNGQTYHLTEQPVVIRFKGAVPKYILIPHIFFMFFGMLFSMRTGIEALFRGHRTYRYAIITLILLSIGGLILGPLVQKYAFGAFWTGWPFGQDLTDNKTLAAIIFWLVAVLKLRKNPAHMTWPVVAAVITLLVYLIPHSMFGSELDYSSGKVTTGPKS